LPIAKNKMFYYLVYGEHVDFRLAPFSDDFIDERRNILRLELPRPTHISSKPFKGTTFKVMACQGKDRCHICKARHTPTDLYPVHIIIPSIGPDEKMIDLTPSGHNAILAVVQQMLDRGATVQDILSTNLRLRRLAKGERPHFECTIIDDISIPIEGDVKSDAGLALTDDDMKLLEKLSALMKTKTYPNPRGSVIATLRSKGWSDEKITIAFETVLDDEGFLKSR